MKGTAWLMAGALALTWALAPAAANAQPELDGPQEMDGPPGDDMGWGDDLGPEPGQGMRRRGRGQRGEMRGRRGDMRGGEGQFGERRRKMRKMRQRARRKMGKIARDPEVRKVIKAQRENKRKLHKLVMRYREEEDSKKKAELKAELKQGLNTQFDADMAVHEMKLKKMEDEIVKLRERIKKRRGLKKKIVEKKLGELTEEEEGWDW